jgi:hypothetical protein
MERTVSLLLVAVVVFGTAGLVPVADAAVAVPDRSAASGADAAAQVAGTPDGSGVNGSLTPGERLSSVLSVQQSEIEGEMNVRAFDARLRTAGTDAGRARVIARELNQSRERLAELRQERERLRDAYGNGSISRGTYVSRTARLAAETASIQRVLSRTADATTAVSNESLRQRGVRPAAVTELRASAADLAGSEVAAVARSAVGKGVGHGFGGMGPASPGQGNAAGPPGAPGQGNAGPSDAANRTDTPNRTDTMPGNGQGKPGRPADSPGERGNATDADAADGNQ